jgi:hypothetical protein
VEDEAAVVEDEVAAAAAAGMAAVVTGVEKMEGIWGLGELDRVSRAILPLGVGIFC